MNPSLAKSIASLVVGVMTFLGWNTSEYVHLLPPIIRHEIVLESSTESDTPSSTNQPTKQTSSTAPSIQKSPQSKSIPTKPTPPKAPKQQVTTPPAPTQQPVYYPAPTNLQDTIKTEIQNIVNEIIPPKTETEIKKEKSNLSLEDKIKKSVVNIYCTRLFGNKIQKITGSGVVIDPSGIIITNAHVAEYFLLAENGNDTNCYIRTGSPAVSNYKAELIYLPTEWINSNKNNLTLQTLTGTGKDDYALLFITSKTRTDAGGYPFDYLTPSDKELTKDQNIFVAGYPAGFSDVKILDNALYELTKTTTVTRVSGFSGGNVDVINTGGTTVAEHGSSGGAVVDESGNLTALIVATSIDNYSGDKNIQAITLPYIKRSIKNSSGKSFESFITNAESEVNNFKQTSLPILANTLLSN